MLSEVLRLRLAFIRNYYQVIFTSDYLNSYIFAETSS